MEIVSGLGMGGAEKTFIDRLDWVPDRLETTVINTIPELFSWELPNGIPYIECSRKKWNFLIRLNSEIKFIAPDIVIVRSPVDLITAATLKILRSNSWKLVYEAHSTKLSSSIFYSALIKPLMRLSITSTNLVVAVSNSVSRGAQCRGAKNLAIHFFGAGVRVSQDKRKEFKILFVGRFVKLKQPMRLLEAINDVRDFLFDAGVSFAFVGKGPLESKMNDYIESNNLRDLVKVLGYLKDLNPLYSESEYIISTSVFEGLPITFYEAKQHGLRIITTPSSGDFDVLGGEDSILADFERQTISEALVYAVAKGQLTPEERLVVQEKNRWMNSESCASRYYQLIDS